MKHLVLIAITVLAFSLSSPAQEKPGPGYDIQLLIDPNPFGEVITVYFKNPSKIKAVFEMYSFSGEPILTRETTGESIEIESEDIPSGDYLYKFKLDEFRKTGLIPVKH